MSLKTSRLLLTTATILTSLSQGFAETLTAQDSSNYNLPQLSSEIQALKTKAIEMNKALSTLEDQLLFPSSTRVFVFVTITSGHFFTLESIQLSIDDRIVANHLYSDQERAALKGGGAQTLLKTNLSNGTHKILATLTGIGPGGIAYKRAVEHTLKKEGASQYLEIAIGDSERQQEPLFAINAW